jgi:1,4-alpha-glucan branching enzyme
VDAVASMIYLDYDKEPGKWIPNTYGGKENLEALAFLKKLTTAVFGEFYDVLLIAEESGTYQGITKPVSEGGLGFNLKWNMGFANDFYDYLKTDPIFRKHHHKALNFPIMYAFKENYILPISHDEVVHGKSSFINKIYGSYSDKFKQMRTALLLIMTYPGKKMTFMGTEFAQFREWDFNNSLEWFMLDFPSHYEMREYVKALNLFYLSHKELHEIDFSERGFKWIYPDLSEENSLVYRRRSIAGKELIIALNFSGSEQSIKIPTRRYDYLKIEFKSEYLEENEYKIYKDNGKFYSDIKLPPFMGVVLSEKRREKVIKL